MTTSLYDILWQGKAPSSYIAVGTINPTRWKSFHSSDLARAEQYMIEEAATKTAYYRVGSLKEPLSRGRGPAEDTSHLPCLHVDFDIDNGTDAHKAGCYPKNFAELQEFLETSGIPEMTAIVDSGNGFHGYIVFDEPIDVREEGARKDAEKLLKGFLAGVNKLASERGWKFDPTAELARVLRYPGTFNHKSVPAKPVTLHSFSGIYHSRPTIEDWVKENAPMIPEGQKFEKRTSSAGKDGDTSKEASFDSILAGCDYVKECVEKPMTEPDWYKLASIVGNSADGEKLWLEISAQDTSRFNEAEARAKLQHALESAGPRRCATIEADGCTACANCTFRGNIVSPYSLGFVEKNLVELAKNHPYEVQTRRYTDLATGVPLQAGSLNDKYRHLIGGPGPHAKLMASPLTRKVDVVAYLPGNRSRFTELENGQSVYNMWQPSKLVSLPGDCETIVGHIQLMLPDDIVRQHFMSCLAHLVQHPGKKIAHLFVLIGKQGNGKSLLFQLIRTLFGEHNTRTLESDHLGMRFNAPLANRQVLMIEELKAGDRLEVYNSIKTMLTERTFIVEEKNVNVYEARTPDWVLASSNHHLPMVAEGDDRRVCAYESPLQPQPAEYYKKLAGAIEAEAGAFLHVLSTLDISAFDPNMPPPMTETKADIIRSSRPQIEQDIAIMIEDRDTLFWRDLVTINDIRDSFYRRQNTRPTTNVVSSALRSLGAENLGNVRLPQPTRLWAIRDVEKWKYATPDEVRAHMSNLRPSI